MSTVVERGQPLSTAGANDEFLVRTGILLVASWQVRSLAVESRHLHRPVARRLPARDARSPRRAGPRSGPPEGVTARRTKHWPCRRTFRHFRRRAFDWYWLRPWPGRMRRDQTSWRHQSDARRALTMLHHALKGAPRRTADYATCSSEPEENGRCPPRFTATASPRSISVAPA